MRKPGGKQKGRPRRTPQRQSRSLEPRTRILIVGEGAKTERFYFHGLKTERDVKQQATVIVKGARGQSPESVVEKAIEFKENEEARGEGFACDEVWCVLDVEDTGKRSSLERAVKMARDNGITLCLSNPCFEVWLLAHFERKARAHRSAQAAAKALGGQWKKHFKQDYAKADKKVYERLAAKTGTAVENARWVREKHHDPAKGVEDCNSSTEVYLLVERLLKGGS